MNYNGHNDVTHLLKSATESEPMREVTFTFRTNTAERQLITSIARLLERTEGDAMRVILRNTARELGMTSDRKIERQPF
jgi:hypothetical protein